MPLTEEEQQWLQQTLGRTGQATPAPAPMPGAIPPAIADAAGINPYMSGFTRNGMRFTVPPPPAVEAGKQQAAADKTEAIGRKKRLLEVEAALGAYPDRILVQLPHGRVFDCLGVSQAPLEIGLDLLHCPLVPLRQLLNALLNLGA